MLVLFAAAAFADAIDGPPDDCATGAWGESSHCGSYCVPSTCDPAAPQCYPEGSTCRENVGLCVRVIQRNQSCGRMPSGVDNPMVDVSIAGKSCSKDSQCDAGEKCEIAPRCVKGGMSGAMNRVCPFATIGFFGIGLLGLLRPRQLRTP